MVGSASLTVTSWKMELWQNVCVLSVCVCVCVCLCHLRINHPLLRSQNMRGQMSSITEEERGREEEEEEEEEERDLSGMHADLPFCSFGSSEVVCVPSTN